MRPSYRCFWHEENTASLKLMPSGWYCFGCGKRPSQEEMEQKVGKEFVDVYIQEEEEDKEDIKETIDYIENLPKKEIRGFNLPYDNFGYYIVWPDKSYYRYRFYNPGKIGKYLGPKGYKPPFFWSKLSKDSTKLALVEGELNSLSLTEAMPEWDCVSLGSASMFTERNLTKLLTLLPRYSKVIAIVDNDKAGIGALIQIKSTLLYKVPFIDYFLMDKDCNEILCESGKEALRQKLQGNNFR